jgi:RNA polymerase sigma-70 factor, ECF subfamily
MAKPEQLEREDPVDSSVTLERLARLHHDFLSALARKLCRGHLDPEDLVQEVLLRTLAHIERLPADVNHRAWMTQVMKNVFTDQLRRTRTRQQAHPDDVAPPLPDDLGDAPWWNGLDSEHVRAAVAELPAELRVAFERFAFGGESYIEIATALGIAKATVGTRVFRARKRLRELLEQRRPS